MKSKIRIAGLAFGLAVCSAAAAQANELGNESRGFCVPLGAELKKENAILTVEGTIANRNTPVYPREHRFFAPTSTQTLIAHDWGGSLLIEKTGEADGFAFSAVLESNTHQIKIRRQIVRCIADDVTEAQIFKIEASAEVNQCDILAGDPSAKKKAEVQARAQAAQHCTSIGQGKVRPVSLKVIYDKRGSCWAGTANMAKVELSFSCEGDAP